jgi:predicted PurR-regulated permease PerM
VSWLQDVLPLKRGQFRELLEEFRRTTRAAVFSTVATAAVQAVVALVGYLVVRAPQPFFFGLVTFFFALIPAIGAGSIVIAVAALQLLTGHLVGALVLALWGFVVVGLVDNVVKPFLMKGGMELHGAVVFFALLGGLAVFGMIGLIAGPLIVSFLVSAVRMYQRDYGNPEKAIPGLGAEGVAPPPPAELHTEEHASHGATRASDAADAPPHSH